eukprot:2040680-Pyramimonas_sp.AAC.1
MSCPEVSQKVRSIMRSTVRSTGVPWRSVVSRWVRSVMRSILKSILRSMWCPKVSHSVLWCPRK